jgi:tripartite-type tricarboxylate transporter receptor subunit TctC
MWNSPNIKAALVLQSGHATRRSASMHTSIKPQFLALGIAILANSPAVAQTTTIVVGFPPGGNYDTYMRTFARHLGKHLPGNPSIVPENMAGAGSLRAANFLFNVAPKDGTTIGVFARGLATQPLLDDKGIQFDARKFNWIGSLSSEVSVALSWYSKPFRTIDDARQREMILAGTGSGADSVIFPYILNGVLGTKFKVVTGYPGAVDYLLAVERGEADGTAGVSWSTITAVKPDWVREKKINVMLQLGTKRHPDLDGAPLVMEFAKSESDKGILALIFARQEMAYPIVAPPGIPAERLQTLRRAFDAVVNDPDYIADARRQALDSDPVKGADIVALIDRIYMSPPDVIARTKLAIENGKKITTNK